MPSCCRQESSQRLIGSERAERFPGHLSSPGSVGSVDAGVAGCKVRVARFWVVVVEFAMEQEVPASQIEYPAIRCGKIIIIVIPRVRLFDLL